MDLLLQLENTYGLISGDVHDSVDRTLVDLGLFELKGIAEPVRAFGV